MKISILVDINYMEDYEMKNDIGHTAGEIWILLQERDELSVSQVPKLIDQKSPIVYQALGWLAREDKIKYENKGRQTLVSLNY